MCQFDWTVSRAAGLSSCGITTGEAGQCSAMTTLFVRQGWWVSAVCEDHYTAHFGPVPRLELEIYDSLVICPEEEARNVTHNS